MHREVIGLLTGRQRSKPSLVHLTRFSIFSREERQALRERYIVETCCARKGYSLETLYLPQRPPHDTFAPRKCHPGEARITVEVCLKALRNLCNLFASTKYL